MSDSNEQRPAILQPQEVVELKDLQFCEGFWHADNAPIFSRKKKSLCLFGKVERLQTNELFYANLWGGEFEGRCYLMKVLRKHEKEGYFDCLWLTKKRELIRNIVGRAMFSEVPVNMKVYKQRSKVSKKRKQQPSAQEQKTPKKVPRQERETQSPAGPSIKTEKPAETQVLL